MISKRIFLQKTSQKDRNMLYKQRTAPNSLTRLSVGGAVPFISSDTQHSNFPSTWYVFSSLQHSSRQSLLCKWLGQGMEDRGIWVRCLARARHFQSSRRPDQRCHPPSLLDALSPAKKWPRREADHSPPNTGTKNMWSCTSTPRTLHGALLN